MLAACAPSAGDDAAARGTGFDFYVLSLAWSPSHCAAEGADAGWLQCGPGRDRAFVVHGLWPQFERGYPQSCQSGEPARVPDALVETMLDIMPSAGLIGHQWRKHGTCTGLGQQDYFRATREAFARVAIPASFAQAETAGEAAPDQVERAFIAANPGLEPAGVAVTCPERRLAEVRICLTRQLAFRACPEVDMRACRTASVDVPAAP
jgi:ribonuclease T2